MKIKLKDKLENFFWYYFLEIIAILVIISFLSIVGRIFHLVK